MSLSSTNDGLKNKTDNLKSPVLWSGWISTEKELPSEDNDAQQILLCLHFQKSESLVLCGLFKNGQFHCLETDCVYNNVSHWAYLPTCPTT